MPKSRPPTMPRQKNAHQRPEFHPRPRAISVPLLTSCALPGGMCLHYLEERGIATRLTHNTSYVNSLAQTVYGRCLIVRRIIPKKSAACGTLALWIWRGGQFPTKELHIISTSHYRAKALGRTLVAHNRHLNRDDFCTIAGLRVTSPVTTACDLCCLDPEDFSRDVGIETMILFLYRECLTVKELADKLQATPHIPGLANARRMLQQISEDPRSCILTPLSEMDRPHT